MLRPSLILAAALLTGCATTGDRFQPVIDMKGVDSGKLAADIGECQAYAGEVAGAGTGAAAGAIAGAVFGALIGAATKTSRNEAALVGALLAAPSGAAKAQGNQREIISRCLAGRGYRVLN